MDGESDGQGHGRPGDPPERGAEANPWTRVSRSVAYENPWIIVYHDRVIRPDGNPGVYGVVHYRSRSVGVVPIDPDGRVLLVGQFRYTLGRYSWEIPAGGAAPDEDPAAAAARELAEETGFTAGSMRLLLRSHPSNSISDEEALCFLATALRAGRASPEGTEQLRLRWLPLDEAMAMIRCGDITDALSILGLQAAALDRASHAGETE